MSNTRDHAGLAPSTVRELNRIINGAMEIDQRNNGGSIAINSSSPVTVDRWRAGCLGAAGSAQRVASTLAGFPSMLRVTGATGVTTAWVGQHIESVNAKALAGKKVTVSFYAASSVLTGLTCNLKYPTATDNYTSATLVEANAVTINSTLTRYTFTTSGVMPANIANGAYLEFVSTTNLGTGTLDITGVQLLPGTVDVPYIPRQYSEELMLCQRYYYKTIAQPLGVTLNTADGYSSVVKFPTTMRTTPTLDSGATYAVGSGSAGTPSLSLGNADAARMSNSANNWTANVTLTLTAGFSAEIS